MHFSVTGVINPLKARMAWATATIDINITFAKITNKTTEDG